MVNGIRYWDIIDTRGLQWPTDWDKLFGRTAPLVLEIGFGRAGHLIHLGKTQPEHNVIGIEIARPSLKKASRKVKANQLEHVRVVDGSGPSLLWYTMLPETVNALYINFPDPWYKEKHNRRQLINDEFLHLAATRMKPGAHLYIATDHADYQPVVTDCLERTPYFQNRLPTTYTTVDTERFRTKYEQKALDEGRVPFYYKWERNDTAAPNHFPIPQETDMPHAVISLPPALDVAEIGRQFTPFQADLSASSDDIQNVNVRFMGLYQQQHGAAFFVETYINEQPSDQRIGLNVSARPEENSYIVQLHSIGFPRPTRGTHMAVGALARWLAGLHEDGRITHHNLRPSP